eukprot:102494_1
MKVTSPSGDGCQNSPCTQIDFGDPSVGYAYMWVTPLIVVFYIINMMVNGWMDDSLNLICRYDPPDSKDGIVSLNPVIADYKFILVMLLLRDWNVQNANE